MPNTKVRKKSLLESYLESIPLGSTLESFRDKETQDAGLCGNGEEDWSFMRSPFGLTHLRDACSDLSKEAPDETSYRAKISKDDTALPDYPCTWNGNGLPADDNVDEGYNSSQLPIENAQSNDSSNSDEDSDRGREMRPLQFKNGGSPSSGVAVSGSYYGRSSLPVTRTQVKHMIDRLSRNVDEKQSSSLVTRPQAKKVIEVDGDSTSSSSCGESVQSVSDIGELKDTVLDGPDSPPADSPSQETAVYRRNGSLTKPVIGEDVANVESSTNFNSCNIKAPLVTIKPLKNLNYTTATSFSRNKAVMVGSAGPTCPESNFSQDPFVLNCKGIVRRKSLPVVSSTIVSDQRSIQSHGRAIKRNITTDDDKPLECKHNTQDVIEIHKNRKATIDLPAGIGSNDTSRKSDVVDEIIKSENGQSGAKLVTGTIATSRSSYTIANSNPTLNHDKVNLESADQENRKGCVVGRKESTGANTAVAQSECCRVMERRVSFSLKPGSSSKDFTNEIQDQGGGEKTSGSREAILDVSSEATTTDRKGDGQSKKVLTSQYSQDAVLKRTEGLKVTRRQESVSAPGDNQTVASDDGTIDTGDFPGEEDDLTHRIDEDLIKYINYEFPGVEALCESATEQRDSHSNVSDQIINSMQDFVGQQETMESVRLQRVLLEVEQARTGTVKALLQVNQVLNKVQGENMKLEVDLKSMIQEKEYLRETLSELKRKAQVDEGVAFSALRDLCSDPQGQREYIIDKQRREELEENMKVFLQSTKRERRELLQALAKSTNQVESAQRDAEKLRIQFKKVKEQLESSNTTFSKILKHNLKATQRLEEELQNALNEKKMLLETLQNGTSNSKELDELSEQLKECQNNLQDTLLERDQLTNKVAHLEKQKRDLKAGSEELQEQLDHSQEVIDKLTESVDELKETLQREVGEKKYLQSCLDETGNLLVHLRNNEKQLKAEKGTLEEDLESEMQQNESLQESLRRTVNEHQSLVDRLQHMNSTHDTVQETLKEASQKEEYYKTQIDELNKNNHLMHYMLEKEKEERYDLQELYDCLEVNHKILKRETTEELMVLRQNCEQLTETNKILTEQNEEFVKTTDDLRTSLEQEEEDNIDLRKTIARNDQHKEKLEKEAQFLREQRIESDKEVNAVKKKLDEVQKALKRESEKCESLSTSMESREELLNKVSSDLASARTSLHEKDKAIADQMSVVRDKEESIVDLQRKVETVSKDRDQHKEKFHESDKECKMTQKACLKYKSELEKLENQYADLEQERNTLRRNLTERANDLELHKVKCNETARQQREQIANLHSKLIEKEHMAMKQKEHYQDTIDNTNSDLALLRKFLDADVYQGSSQTETRSQGSSQGNENEADDLELDLEGIDVEFLRSVHQEFENEMQSHVANLEGMLHVSRQTHDSVTVVQSPMSKIKLEEIKVLRDETFELRAEVKSLFSKLNIVVEDFATLKAGISGNALRDSSEIKVQALERTSNVESELEKLNESISKIEARHVSIIRRNSSLLDYARKKIRRARTPVKDDHDSDGEESDKLDREIMVLTLKEENLKLKSFVQFLNKKINLQDGQLLKSVMAAKGSTAREKPVERPAIEGQKIGDVTDYDPSTRGTGQDTSALSKRRPFVKSKSARSSPNVERSYAQRSFSGRSSPISQSQSRFRPISPSSSKLLYGSPGGYDSDSSSQALRYARSVSDYSSGTTSRNYSRGRSLEPDQLDLYRREGIFDDEASQRQRRLSRHSDGDPTSPTVRRREMDGNNNKAVRRKSDDWDMESRQVTKKGYSFLDSEASMYQYQDSQGSRILRQKMGERYRSVDSGSLDRQSTTRTDYRGFISTSSYDSSAGHVTDSRRSKTLPRTRAKYP